ncbi:MAG: hypothetical protein U0414_32830 [Polyangiaceae bacterium]
MRRSIQPAVFTVLLLVVGSLGCRSDEDGAGGASGSTTSGTHTSSASSTSSAASTSSSTHASASSSDSASSSTGGEPACPPILVTSGVLDECATVGPLALVADSTTECTADSSVYWPARIFKLPLKAGDCVHMSADNAGSPLGADLFGAIVDPGGKSLLFDEERDCTVTDPAGDKCPDGGATIQTDGEGYVVVGAWEGMGCTPGEFVPIQLAVSVNGVDVTAEPICLGDLQKIIP